MLNQAGPRSGALARSLPFQIWTLRSLVARQRLVLRIFAWTEHAPASKFLVDGGSGAIMLDQTGVGMPPDDLRSPCCKPREYPQREINKLMSRLTIVGYDDPDQAEEVRLKLRKLQREYVVDLKDAVVAIKDERGKVKLHQSVDFSADGTFSFSFLGSLTGLILLNAAAATSASSGALTEAGIDARFMKELAATLSPGSSVLFVLTGIPTPHRDKLLEELKGTGGKILQTTLSHEDQGALQAALSAAKAGG